MADFFLVMHILAFVSWMAGLLYLPRIFVYHCRAEPGSQASELFKIMERRLLWATVPGDDRVVDFRPCLGLGD